ncbi:O-antigen ligase family protein [Janthinobacterium lividum]|uniref:O-antigen ligase family protein n=1 Tax=Janthinobacterium lividum TaxID=29581 RepID=UPI001407CD19|nr:O-antigen ligase family protein [Janthinobacterium lividum]NHQ93272.1 O-antigen ligase family protein [Janthinobacterium lividum]
MQFSVNNSSRVWMDRVTRMLVPLYYGVLFFVFVGEFKIYIGASSVSLPISFALIGLIFMVRLLREDLILTRNALILCAIAALGILTTLLRDPGQLQRAVAAVIPLVVSAMALVSLRAWPVDLDKARQAILYGGIVLALWTYLGFIQSFGVNGDYYDKKLMVETLLGRSNYLAAFLFFLAATFFYQNKYLFLFFVGAILATMSRGGILIISLFILYIFWTDKKYAHIKYFTVFLSILFVLYLFFEYGYSLFMLLHDNEYKIPDSFNNRIILWEFSADLIAKSPWLGVGPNGFRSAIEAAGNMEDVWGAHNSILLLWLNYGIIGLLLYLKYLHNIYREISKAARNTPIFQSIKVAFLFLLLFSLFEPLIGSVSFELLLVMLYITAKNINRQDHTGASLPRTTAPV